MTARWAQCIAVCCLVLSAASYASEAKPPTAAGDEKALWLVRTAADGSTFDVVCRPAGGTWQWAARDRVGAPVLTAAIEGNLYVAFGSGQCYIFSLEAEADVPALSLPSAPLAMCGSDRLELKEPASAIAMTPSTGPPAAATSGPATSRSAVSTGTIAVDVLAHVPSEWQRLATAGDLPADAAGRLRMLALDGVLYLLVPGGDGRPNRLATWRTEQWSDVPLEQSLADGRVIGVAAVAGRLVIVTAPPSPHGAAATLQVASWDAKTGEFTYQPLAAEGRTDLWKAGTLPQVSALADKLALVWQDDANLKMVTCNPATGGLDPIEDIKIFRKPPPDDRGRIILAGLLGGIMGVALVLVLSVRPTAGAPQAAPSRVMLAAAVSRRFLATLIDLLPFLLAASIYSQAATSLTIQQVWGMMANAVWYLGSMPSQMAYGLDVAIILYLAYAILAEFLLGATVGKMIFKMRVVADDGGRAGLRGVVLRNLVKVIELAFPPLLLIGPLLDRTHQRLGDILARTTVVDTRPVAPSGQDGAQPPNAG